MTKDKLCIWAMLLYGGKLPVQGVIIRRYCPNGYKAKHPKHARPLCSTTNGEHMGHHNLDYQVSGYYEKAAPEGGWLKDFN